MKKFLNKQSLIALIAVVLVVGLSFAAIKLLTPKSDNTGDAPVVTGTETEDNRTEIIISSIRAPRILEVEPFAMYYSNADWVATLQNIYGKTWTESQISVKRMTTNEFNCNTDDLANSYDLIYFGNLIGDAGHKTYYTEQVSKLIDGDTAFTGCKDLIYMHVGPRWKIYYTRSFGLANNTFGLKADNTHFYTQTSGNDITKIKENQVKGFLTSGGTVVFSSYFYKTDNGTLNVNTKYIDASSNIYDLANGLKTQIGFGVVNLGYSIDASEKARLLSRYDSRYINISASVLPPAYSNTGDGKASNACYVNGSDPTDKTLKFAFSIEDLGSIDTPYEYILGLYVDLNADGRYNSSAAEELKGFSIYDASMGQYIDPEETTLKTGHSYIVKRDVSELLGVIPWKLEVTRAVSTVNANGQTTITPLTVTSSLEGFTAIKAQSDQKETIRVLQLYMGVGDDGKKYRNFWGGGNWGTTDSSSLVSYLLPTTDDLINAAKRTNPSFNINNYYKADGTLDLTKLYEYFYANLNENQIQAKDVVLYDINDKAYYIKKNGGTVSGYAKIKQGTGYVYQNRNDIKAIEPSGDNGDNGITVTRMFYKLFKQLDEFLIYTDRMSCAQYEAFVAAGNKLIDQYDMVILGFGDTYDDLNNASCLVLQQFINAGKTVLFTHDTTSFFNDPNALHRAEYPLLGTQGVGEYDLYKNNGVSYTSRDTGSRWCWGYNINKFFRTSLALDRYGVKKTATGYTQDVAKLNGNISFNMTNQGFTDNFDKNGANDSDGNMITTKVVRNNKGTITEYPYSLSEYITIGKTHMQYYQMDLENPNVVVWYSLYSDTTTMPYYQNPKDARNYYYIYNVGNVTYSGAGHALDNANNIKDEIKLFVNTVVAAYRASGSPYKTYVTNSDKSSSSTTDYLYIDFDTEDTTTALGDLIISDGLGVQKKRVTFVVEDNSIVPNSGMKVKYYQQQKNADGTVKKDANGDEVWTEVDLKTYVMKPDKEKFGNAVAGSGGMYPVVKEVNYGFDLDITPLKNSSQMTIAIFTIISYGSVEAGDYYEDTTIKYVTLLRRGFFEID